MIILGHTFAKGFEINLFQPLRDPRVSFLHLKILSFVLTKLIIFNILLHIMSGKSLDRVLVTGASGYIASHVVHQLLSAKDPTTGQPLYIVRGTVRDASNEQKCAPLREMAAKIGDGAEDRLELVSADLMKDDGWENAVDGCKYIEHMASPLPMSIPKNPDDLIKPAVGGVERVLNAAAKNRDVKRVVMTSSSAAISGGSVPWRSHKTFDHLFTEDDWTDPDLCPPYQASKTVAERRAWDLWRALPEEGRFELVVINPVIVIGPLVVNNPGASMSLVTKVLTNDIPMYPSIYLDIVDVRDVAKLHTMSLTQDGISGQRFLACSETTPSITLLNSVKFLQTHYNPRGFNIKARAMPNWLVHIMKYVSSDVKLMSEMLDSRCKYDISKSIDTFDFHYIQPRDSYLAAAESCLEFGCVAKPTTGGGLGTGTVLFAVALAAAAAAGTWYFYGDAVARFTRI